MSERIVAKNADGTCVIFTPSEAHVEELRRLTDDNKKPLYKNRAECVYAIAVKDVPEGLTWRITDAANIPGDRTFRNAWTDDVPGDLVDVDVAKAIEITHGRRREKRDVEFAPFDKAILINAGDVQAEAARVEVRGRYDTMQSVIDSCSSASELMALIESEGL